MQRYTFADSGFARAHAKRAVFKAWVRFLKNGLRFEDFAMPLYDHLHVRIPCSFVAYFTRMGFFEAFFERGETKVLFLSQFDKRRDCSAFVYGGQRWGSEHYEDVNKAMVEAASQYIPALIEHALAEQRSSDLAEARRLAAKHGVDPLF